MKHALNLEIERCGKSFGLRSGFHRGFAQSLRASSLLVFEREAKRLNCVRARLRCRVNDGADLRQIVYFHLNYVRCRIARDGRLASFSRVAIVGAYRVADS